MKGLIIIGYQGIGKSSLSGKDGCIDLESSNFYVDGKRDQYWYIPYTNIAMDLANQGYTVFTSSHVCVCKKLWLLSFWIGVRYKNIAKIVIFRPSPAMKDEWIERLQERYNRTSLEKDYRALMGAKENFFHNIWDLDQAGFEIFEPDSLDYNLYDYVKIIRERYCKESK